MDFDFSTAKRIIFGKGKLSILREIINEFGNRVLLVTGRKKPDPQIITSICEQAGLNITIYKVNNEPDVETINDVVQMGRKNKCDFVIGFGGGSVIDAGKAAAALLNNEGTLLDYLEVVGKGNPLENPSKPYVAIPTTAGTGSEVTRNAVISVPSKRVKVSMRNAFLLPSIALIDPELTYDVPPHITAATGMDAFTQVVEPFVTKITNPFVDMLCKEAIPRAAGYIFRAWENGRDQDARENMSFVSLMGGLALANAKLGAVHGFAGPIGGMFHAPHGAICAALLAPVMRVNSELIQAKSDDRGKIRRFDQVAKWITGREDALIPDGVDWIADLSKKMNIPGLSEYGICENDFKQIIEKAKKSSSMKGNPIQLSEIDMIRILKAAL